MKRTKIFATLLMALSILSCTPVTDNDEPFVPGEANTEVVAGKDLSYEFPASSGFAVISVSAKKSWCIEYANADDSQWLSFTPSSGGKGREQVSINAKSNTADEGRKATLILKCDNKESKIIISQKAGDILVVADGEYSLDYNVRQLEFDVTSNVDYEVTTSMSWIKLVDSKATNTKKLVFSIEENDNKYARDAEIYIRSESKEQVIKVTQGYTTHPPIEDDELKRSIDMSYQIREEVVSTIDEIYSPGKLNIDELISHLKLIDDVINVEKNISSTAVMVQQRDSIWVNYSLFEDKNIMSEKEEAEIIAKLKKLQNSSSGKPVDRKRLASINSNKKALILAPYKNQGERSVVSDIDAYKQYLIDAGFRSSNIHVFEDKTVTLRHFRADFQCNYDVVIIQTHGVVGTNAVYKFLGELQIGVPNVTIISTSIPYTYELAKQLVSTGQMDWGEIAINGEGDDMHFSITPQFIGKGDFSDMVFITGACESAMIPDDSKYGEGSSLMQAYLNNGAQAVVGWRESIKSTLCDDIIKSLLKHLSNGLSFQDFEQYWIKRDSYDRLCEQLVQIYKDYCSHFKIEENKHKISATNQRLFYLSGTKTDNYLIGDPTPVPIEAKVDKEVSFSWDSSLKTFRDALIFQDEITGFDDVEETYNWNGHTEDQEYTVLYDVYIYEVRIGTTTEKSFKWKPTSNGDFDWSVNARLLVDGETVRVFEGPAGQFSFNAPVEAYLKTNPESTLSLPSASTNFVVEVESNVDYDVKVVDGDWLREKDVKRSGDKTSHIFNASKNPTVKNRTCTISFVTKDKSISKSVTVSQQPSMYPDDWASRDFWHRSMVLFYTRQGCGYSPDMTRELKAFKSRKNNKVEILSIYYDDGYPLSFGDVYYYISDEYEFEATPLGAFDARKRINSAYTASLLEGLITESESLHSTNSGIGIKSQLNNNTLDVDLTLCIKQAGIYKVGVYLIENNISEYQAGYGDNYLHQWVGRAALSAPLGDVLNVTSKNTVKSLNYHASLSSSWSKKNLRVLVFVQKETGTHKLVNGIFQGRYIDNCVSVPIGQSKPVSFVNRSNSNIEDVYSGDDIDFN